MRGEQKCECHMWILYFAGNLHSFFFFFPSPGFDSKSGRLAAVGLLGSAVDGFVDGLGNSCSSAGGVVAAANRHLKV